MSETFTCQHCGTSTDDIILGRVHEQSCLARTRLRAEIAAGDHGKEYRADDGTLIPAGWKTTSVKDINDRLGILPTAELLLSEGYTYPDVFALLRDAGVNQLDIEAAALVMEDWKKR